jgi:hypothetical protein
MFRRKGTIKARLLTAFWAVAFLLVSILAASANLHQAIHHEDDHGSEHVCALTLIRDGLVEPLTLPELVSLPGIELTMPAPWCPKASEPTAPPFRLPCAVGPPELG